MIKKIIITVLCITLTGCFALRRPDALPTQLTTLQVQASEPYSSFTLKLKRTLKNMHVNLTPDASNILTINNISFTHSTPSIGTSTQVRTYHLAYMVRFSLAHGHKKGKHMHVILPEQTLTTYRELILNINQLLDTNDEFEIIRNEMEATIITKLLNRLYSKEVQDHLQ